AGPRPPADPRTTSRSAAPGSTATTRAWPCSLRRHPSPLIMRLAPRHADSAAANLMINPDWWRGSAGEGWLPYVVAQLVVAGVHDQVLPRAQLAAQQHVRYRVVDVALDDPPHRAGPVLG